MQNKPDVIQMEAVINGGAVEPPSLSGSRG